MAQFLDREAAVEGALHDDTSVESDSDLDRQVHSISSCRRIAKAKRKLVYSGDESDSDASSGDPPRKSRKSISEEKNNRWDSGSTGCWLFRSCAEGAAEK